MKVLLKEDVENLGLAGEIRDVTGGFGRNFLIPKGLAVRATPGALNQAEIWRSKAETRRAEVRAEYDALAAKIEEVTLTYTARAGETGKLYGSITTAQIADDLNQALGTEIDRRKVGTEPLRQLGQHKVIVRLSSEVQPHVTVIVEPEGERFVTSAPVQEIVEEDEYDDDEYDDDITVDEFETE